MRPETSTHPRRSPVTWRSRRRFSESVHQRLTLLSMCVATFMIQIDVTIVNVALPRIQASLHMSPGGLEWVISGYALALAALIPVGGAVGDRYGRKRTFVVGLAVFGLGSAACAVSPNAAALIVSRAFQGVGGAAMLALSLSIITETFPGKQRAGAIGTWAAIGGTGFGLGPVAGGILLSFAGWSSVFWVNVPVAAVGIALTAVAVRESGNAQARRLDRPGLVLSALGLVGLTLGLVEASSHPWGSLPVAGPLLAGAALLTGFFLWERHSPDAMIPPALLRARSFAAAAGIYLIVYTAFSGVLFYVTLLYQDVNGWPALDTGLSWLAMNIPFLAMAQLTGRLDRRFSAATVITAGCLAGCAGVLALSFVTPTTPFALTVAGYVVSGAGVGTLVPGITHVAMRDVPAGVSGAASGVVNASRQIGTSVGLAVLGSVGVGAAVSDWAAKAGRLPAPIRVRALGQAQNVGGGRIAAVSHALGSAYRDPAAESFVHGYHLAVTVGAACLLVAAVVAVIGFRTRPSRSAGPSDRDGTRAGASAPGTAHGVREAGSTSGTAPKRGLGVRTPEC